VFTIALILSPPFVAIFQNLTKPSYWRPCAGPPNLGWHPLVGGGERLAGREPVPYTTFGPKNHIRFWLLSTILHCSKLWRSGSLWRAAKGLRRYR